MAGTGSGTIVLQEPEDVALCNPASGWTDDWCNNIGVNSLIVSAKDYYLPFKQDLGIRMVRDGMQPVYNNNGPYSASNGVNATYAQQRADLVAQMQQWKAAKAQGISTCAVIFYPITYTLFLDVMAKGDGFAPDYIENINEPYGFDKGASGSLHAGDNFRNAWANATAYAVGDVVTVSGYGYYCYVAHTSNGDGPAGNGFDISSHWVPSWASDSVFRAQQMFTDRAAGKFPASVKILGPSGPSTAAAGAFLDVFHNTWVKLGIELTGKYDYINVHDYPAGYNTDNNCAGDNSASLGQALGQTMTTEFGFAGITPWSSPNDGTAEEQAGVILRGWMANIVQNGKCVYAYGLGFNDSNSTSGDPYLTAGAGSGTYGMMKNDAIDGSPAQAQSNALLKPAYTAVRSMLGWFSDKGNTRVTYAPPLTVSGAPSSIVSAKSDGTSWAVLWDSTQTCVDVANHANGKLTNTGSGTATLTCPTATQWTAYDPIYGTTLKTQTGGTTFTLPFGTYPLVVKVNAPLVQPTLIQGASIVAKGTIPPVKDPSPDAVARRAVRRLYDFASWVNSNGVRGFIGETGVPGVNPANVTGRTVDPNPDDRWVIALDRLYDACDANGLGVAAWTACEWNQNLRAYNGNGTGGAIDTAASSARVIEKHLGATRGVNVTGADFGSGSNPSAGALNAGTYGTDYQYPSAATATYLASRGVKVVRLAVRWPRLQPTLKAALNPTELGRLTTCIGNFNTAGIGVIVNSHDYGRYDTLAANNTMQMTTGVLDLGQNAPMTVGGTMIAAFADYWTRMATALRGTPGLIGYGLTNEPHDLTGGLATWQSATTAARTGIRTVDTNTDLYVNGYSYATAATWGTVNGPTPWLPTSDGHIVYEAHLYLDDDRSGSYANTYAQELALALSEGY